MLVLKVKCSEAKYADRCNRCRQLIGKSRLYIDLETLEDGKEKICSNCVKTEEDDSLKYIMNSMIPESQSFNDLIRNSDQ